MTAKATLKTYRQSPRKVRLVADAIRGKKAGDALNTLAFMTKRAADPVVKLLKSAVANAKQQSMKEEQLYIETLTVDEGSILYRRRARARGRSMPIRKRTSHISLTLKEKAPASPKATQGKPTKKAAPKVKVEKTVAKKKTK